MTALRGTRMAMTTSGASTAFGASLGEGLQSELLASGAGGIDVTVLLPGYIRSEMTEKVEQKTRFMVDTETGVRSMMAAIEARKRRALVPGWPWRLIGPLLKVLPLKVVSKLV